MRLASLLIRERSTLVYWISLLFAPVAAAAASAFGLIAKGWRDDIAASMGVATWVMYFSAGVVASMHLHEMRRETDYRQADATEEYPAPVGFEPVYADDVEVLPSGIWNRTENTLTVIQKPRKRPRKWSPKYRQLETVTTAMVEEAPDGTSVRYYDVNELLWRWARYGGADADKLGERDWTPKAEGKPFDYEEFATLRKWLIEKRMAWWLNEKRHQVGWRLSNNTRRVMSVMREQTTPPRRILVPYTPGGMDA